MSYQPKINDLSLAINILRQFGKLTYIHTIEISACLEYVATEHPDSNVRKRAAHARFIIEKHIETAERWDTIPAAYHAMIVAFKLHNLKHI